LLAEPFLELPFPKKETESLVVEVAGFRGPTNPWVGITWRASKAAAPKRVE